MDHFRGTREGLGADGNGAWNDRAETVEASYRKVLRGRVSAVASWCGPTIG